MRSPWSHAELADIKRSLEENIRKTEESLAEARPLPPLTADEAENLLHALTETAMLRVLTDDEVFLHGQLLECYRMAVQAATLGYKGRFFVLSEESLARATEKAKG